MDGCGLISTTWGSLLCTDIVQYTGNCTFHLHQNVASVARIRFPSNKVWFGVWRLLSRSCTWTMKDEVVEGNGFDYLGFFNMH